MEAELTQRYSKLWEAKPKISEHEMKGLASEAEGGEGRRGSRAAAEWKTSTDENLKLSANKDNIPFSFPMKTHRSGKGKYE